MFHPNLLFGTVVIAASCLEYNPGLRRLKAVTLCCRQEWADAGHLNPTPYTFT